MKASQALTLLIVVSTFSMQAMAADLKNPVAKPLSPYGNATGPADVLYADFLKRLEIYAKEFEQKNGTKPDTEELKEFMGYYKLTDTDRKELDEMFRVIGALSAREWKQVVWNAIKRGTSDFKQAINPGLAEKALLQWNAPASEPAPTLPEPLAANWGEYLTSRASVVYSKHVQQTGGASGSSPILIGGGFPFNQTQFSAFNEKIARIADLDLYDPICNGMSVLYDAVLNDGRGCRPYQPAGPVALLTDEIAFKFSRSLITLYASFMKKTVTEQEDALFRLTRISFRAISLTDQAHAISAVAGRQGYRDGEAILAGISYGGLIAARTGAIFPGRFKALVLFSPGVENSAHINVARDLNAMLENSVIHRRALRKKIHDIAYNQRYGDYRPVVLNDHDEAYRDGLQKKMMGELDMDLGADLARVEDRVYMITGALDAAINPKAQIKAMRNIFSKDPIKGSFILIPKGGHALWGNPAQSAEDAVKRCLEEIEKGDQGAFRDGGAYAWNDGTGSFDLLGEGLDGLAKADALVDQLKNK